MFDLIKSDLNKREMNKQKYQSGFAHMVGLVIVLLVVIVGLLGFVFYQNFIQKKADNTTKIVTKSETKKSTNTPNTSNNDSTNLPETAFDNVTGSKLALRYPSEWTITNTPNKNPDASQGNIIKINSPDNAITIQLWTNISGIGGTCGGEGLDIVKLDRYSLKNYPGYTFYAATEYYHMQDYIGYAYSAKLLESDDKISVGTNNCGLGLGVFPLATNSEKINSLSITLNSLNKVGTDTLEKINKAKTNKYYNAAISIAQSLFTE